MIDFKQAIASFARASKRTILTCADVAPTHWVAHPRAGYHSMSEVVEHMALSNGLFAGRLEKIFAAPVRGSAYAVLEDEEIPHLFERVDEPPGIAEPSGSWVERDDALRRLEESAQRVIAFGETEVSSPRMRGAPHPLFGPLDGVQWALFAAAHTERHRSELIGLKHRLSR